MGPALYKCNKNLGAISEIYQNTNWQATVDSIDQDLLKLLIEFLEPFKFATLKFETEKQPMLGYVYFIMKNLKDKLLGYNILDETDVRKANKYALMLSILANRVYDAIEVLYTTRDFELHSVAAFMNPKFNELKWLDRHQKKLVYKYCREYISTTTTSSSSSESDSNSSAASTPTAVAPSGEEEEFLQFANQREEAIPNDDEVRKYCKEKSFSSGTAFQFWKINEKFYPNLSKLAKKTLAIPSSSAASERAFSTAGRIVEERRTSLSSSSIDSLMFLHAQN